MSHVAHLTSAHPRNDIRIFLKECRSLSCNGHDVTLVVADGHGDAKQDGITIVDIGLTKGRLARMTKTTRKMLQKAVEINAELYHLHDPELLPIGLKLKKLGKKVIFDAHEDVPQQILSKHYLHPIARHFLSWAFRHYERYACIRFDGIVTATPYICDKFLKIQRQTVDINNFPILGELESTVPWDKKNQTVCYIGSIAEIRGVKQLVRAMEKTRTNVRLSLVGGFAEESVEAEVRIYLGWNKVQYAGILDRNGVREVLEQSIAGIVTLHPVVNYLDSLPIKMFEYMSAGIPVIASDFPLWRQILEVANCGICVDPLDPSSIAKAIDDLVENPDLAKEMGENGRRLIETKFNWTNEETKLIKFYDHILRS